VKTLDVGVTFNGDTWLQCAANGLDEAEWLDIEGGRYSEKCQSFFIQRIDFEHKLTPEAFPEEPEGTKTMKVKLVE